MRNKRLMATAALAAALACTACPALADDDLNVSEDGIGLALAGETVKIELGGKLQFDLLAYDTVVTGGSAAEVRTAEIRRARPDLRIAIADTVSLRAEWELSGSRGWRNLYAQIEPFEDLTLRGGNFTVPFSMEELQNTARAPFAERSLVSTISPGFGLGGQAGYSSRRLTLRIGYFDDALDPQDGRSSEHGRGLVGRVTGVPVDKEGLLVHLGLGLERRTFEPGESLRFSASAGSTFAPDLIRTRRLDGLSRLIAANAELGVVAGSFSAQAQYVHQRLERDAPPQAKLSAAYVQASWMPTGESYRYARGSGVLAGPRIGRRMALELAVRLGWLDATDPQWSGGSAQAFDISASLHLTSNFRVLAAGTLASREDMLGSREDWQALVLRSQLAF